MSIFHVIILAIVQGLAELLPVSSSAHVVVAEKLMGLDASSPQMTLLLVGACAWNAGTPAQQAGAAAPLRLDVADDGKQIKLLVHHPDGGVIGRGLGAEVVVVTGGIPPEAEQRLRRVGAQGVDHVLDADIENYFGSIGHDKLLTLVAQRVSDRRV